jgi:uncharacterized membrane protein YfcA
LLTVALGASAALFSAFAARVTWRNRTAGPPGDPATELRAPSAGQLAVGFVTDFFDTLGVGSFAPTTSLFKLLKLCPDRLIPGTLMVGHALPTLAQAIIYITVIKVDPTTLVLLIAASGAGAWLGAGVVAGWPRRPIQIGMGVALLAASAILLAKQLGALPAGGDLITLSGTQLAIGLCGNFMLGAIMNIGIGAYAPSLIMFGLLGMDVKAIFPIMMGSCAFIMPVGSVQFVRKRSHSVRAALGLTLGGVPAVLIAAFWVKKLDVTTLNWLVLVVVVYTALAMLWSATKDKEPG